MRCYKERKKTLQYENHENDFGMCYHPCIGKQFKQVTTPITMNKSIDFIQENHATLTSDQKVIHTM